MPHNIDSMLDEKNERIRMRTKNKRARPWKLDVRYLSGIGSNWGWMKRGMYRTEEEAIKSGEHFKRNFSHEKEFRVSSTEGKT